MALLPTAYFPSIFYLQSCVGNERIVLEKQEHFLKQTIRSRCEILSANGILSLSVPIVHEDKKGPIAEQRVSYTTKWQIEHWRAIESAYASSPFFEDYELELRNLVFDSEEKLFERNLRQLEFAMEAFGLDFTLTVTSEYEHFPADDCRNLDFLARKTMREYQQVFTYDKPFVTNLSFLDLLFNLGPLGRNWLTNLSV